MNKTNRKNLLLAAICALILTPSSVVAQTIAIGLTDPEAIFSRARDVWDGEKCPSRLDYVISVSAINQSVLLSNHYRAIFLVDEQYISVNSISDEEVAHPTTPHGTDYKVSIAGIKLEGLSRALTEKINPDYSHNDILGVPYLEPLYSFGFSHKNALPIARDPKEFDFKIIGAVQARSANYNISLLGVERTASGSAFHLKFSPLRSPDRYRLRDAWIDTQSFRVLQVITQGNFDSGPPTTASWLVTFTSIDDCQLIDKELSLSKLDYGRSKKLLNVTVSFAISKDLTSYRPAVLMHTTDRDRENYLHEPDQ